MIHLASLLLIFVLIFLSIFFSAAETSFFSLHHMDRDFIKRNHPKLGKWVLAHIDAPRKTLTTLLVGNLIVNTWLTALVAFHSFELWGPQSTIWVTSIFGVLLIGFGEMIPKMVAMRFKIPVALISAIPVHFFTILFAPLRICMKWLTDQFFHLLARERSDTRNALSEDELKVLVSIGEEEGMLDSEERKRLHELFELGNRPVREIMTPRTDLVGLDVDEDSENHFQMIRKNHYSLMPVFQNSLDQVIGVVDAQTYLLASEPRIRQLMKKPVFIPETKKISDLLADFRRDREDFAVCVDEHGGTAGVVTLEDILEEIFGEFEDEYAKTKEPIRRLDDESFLVEGKISLDDLNEYFQSTIASESETTLAGYLMEQIGEIPSKGTRFENDAFEFQVQDMQRQRIRTVIMRKKS